MAISKIVTNSVDSGVTLTSPVMNTITSAAATALTLQSAGTTAITVNTSQNVGIGTSAPTAKLNVSKDGGAVDSQIVRITDTNTANTFGPSSLTMGMMNHYAPHPKMSIAGTNGIAFCVGDGSDFTTQRKVEIDSSGNLLVGTISGSNARVYIVADAAAVIPFLINNTQAGTSSGSIVYFRRNGTNTGTIDNTGTTTSYNTSSDYRLKNTITPMTGALDKVALLKPCTYKWNTDGSNGQGFIAHELDAVVPGCVSGEKDAVDAEGKPKYQGIDTSFLVATLTAAIQEQQALILALTARLETLEAK